MKKIIRNVLAGVGVAAVAFTGYVLLDEYTKEQERLQAETEKAEKVSGFSPEYIERRRAMAAKRAAERAANQNTTSAQAVGSDESATIGTGEVAVSEMITDTAVDSTDTTQDAATIGETNEEKDNEHRTSIS